jgi:hypothetical protein
MLKALSISLLLALVGCAAGSSRSAGPCAAGEATYACQVERYHTAP